MTPSLTTLALWHSRAASRRQELVSTPHPSGQWLTDIHRRERDQHIRFALLAIIAGASKRVRDEARKTLNELNNRSAA